MITTTAPRRQMYVVQGKRVRPLNQLVIRPASTLAQPAPLLPGYPDAAVIVMPQACSRKTERVIWLVARQFRNQGRPTRLVDQ